MNVTLDLQLPREDETTHTRTILQRYISDELLNGRVEVAVEDDLLGGGIVDSVAMMWLVTFIEETFEVNIPLEDVTIQNFRTIETIAHYVKQRKDRAV